MQDLVDWKDSIYQSKTETEQNKVEMHRSPL
jgi:hypothetical protein